MSSTTSSTTIDLFRHGACEGGEIFRGHIDTLLSQEGFEQMSNTIGEAPPTWDLIVSSPLRRCADFAEMLSIQYDTPMAIEENFKEVFFGDWDGENIDSTTQSNPVAVGNFWRNPDSFPPPNGETLTEFKNRVIPAWQNLLQTERNKRILCVSHGGVIRLLLAEILGMAQENILRFDIPYASLSRIQIFHSDGFDDWPQVQFINNIYP